MDSGFRRNDVSVNESVNNYGSVRGEPVELSGASLSNHTRCERVVPFAVSLSNHTQ